MNDWEKVVKHFDIEECSKRGLFKVSITPDMAGEMLKRNTGNRRIRQTLVAYLKKQIENNEWQSDHPQPIVFSDSGRLIDGQHRLIAIVESNRTVVARVETGCPDGIREYLDTGIVRSLDDRISFVDDTSLNKIVGQIITAWWFAFYNTSGRSGAGKPSPEQARGLLEDHRDSILWAASIVQQKKLRAVGRIPVAVAACQMYEINQAEAAKFYAALFQQDSEIQQARILRDWLLRNAGKMGGGSFASEETYGRSVYCMDAYLRGKKVISVRIGDWSKAKK